MTDHEKLKGLIAEADELKKKSVTGFDPSLQAWRDKCFRFLGYRFGRDSLESDSFRRIAFSPQVKTGDENQSDYAAFCRKGLDHAKEFLLDILADLDTKQKIADGENVRDKVFIVHGHDSALKYQVANLLRKIGIPPIILHEQINASDTIIEKLEKYGAEAAAAVILFTPDDFGNVGTEEERRKRARQNVVFEAGYFMGLLGRDKTILIVTDSTIELPGDLQGVVYTNNQSVEFAIARELKSMGLPVDLNKLYG